jgi:hypothetical protein
MRLTKTKEAYQKKPKQRLGTKQTQMKLTGDLWHMVRDFAKDGFIVPACRLRELLVRHGL